MEPTLVAICSWAWKAWRICSLVNEICQRVKLIPAQRVTDKVEVLIGQTLAGVVGRVSLETADCGEVKLSRAVFSRRPFVRNGLACYKVAELVFGARSRHELGTRW